MRFFPIVIPAKAGVSGRFKLFLIIYSPGFIPGVHFFIASKYSGGLRLWGRLKEASLTGARKQAYIRRHTECLDAIRDRDPQRAEALMRTHLETVKGNMFGAVEVAAVG